MFVFGQNEWSLKKQLSNCSICGLFKALYKSNEKKKRSEIESAYIKARIREAHFTFQSLENAYSRCFVFVGDDETVERVKWIRYEMSKIKKILDDLLYASHKEDLQKKK